LLIFCRQHGLATQKSGIAIMKSKTKLICGISALIVGVAASAQVATVKTAAQTGKVAALLNGASRALLAPTPMANPAAAATPAVATLPPLDLSDMRMWNWNGKWLASEWDNVNGPIPWRYNHIVQKSGKDTVFTLDATGAPQLQGMNGTPAYTRGLWETEVTLPSLHEGVIVAPLWIYDTGSKDEIDFEFAGRRGLDVSMHVYVNGVHQQNTVRLFAGTDMSGQRHRFGIKIDETAGYVEMYVDGQRVHRWERSSTTSFISHPMKPWIEMWPTNPSNAGFVQWAGQWKGLAPNEKLTMTVHGYGYTTIP
jgi:hypothetical protein